MDSPDSAVHHEFGSPCWCRSRRYHSFSSSFCGCRVMTDKVNMYLTLDHPCQTRDDWRGPSRALEPVQDVADRHTSGSALKFCGSAGGG